MMIEVALEAHQADKEIWRDIVGYEGLYKVSNFGRVDNLEWCDAQYNMTYGVHAERQYLSRDELGRFCSTSKIGTR